MIAGSELSRGTNQGEMIGARITEDLVGIAIRDV